jgi:Ca2+-dependent lipid-binding protein
MIHSILGPMMYQPNVFTLNFKQLLSGAPIDTAIRVIKVVTHGTRCFDVMYFPVLKASGLQIRSRGAT